MQLQAVGLLMPTLVGRAQTGSAGPAEPKYASVRPKLVLAGMRSRPSAGRPADLLFSRRGRAWVLSWLYCDGWCHSTIIGPVVHIVLTACA